MIPASFVANVKITSLRDDGGRESIEARGTVLDGRLRSGPVFTREEWETGAPASWEYVAGEGLRVRATGKPLDDVEVSVVCFRPPPVVYRGIPIEPCALVQSHELGFSFFVRAFHHAGKKLGERSSTRFRTREEARSYIDAQFDFEQEYLDVPKPTRKPRGK